ncbi:hypothetical protein BpHYR1_029144 [Brachionus plicatilis]|uniref:Uncharacterized protein n=1 Tax=Brachionus plicatilis TaxID=10195 RepID=A0A3M7QSQ8_BRAPC|nr:hypothetical protein BpHYR1_029144 [Brachionus plicatilis]
MYPIRLVGGSKDLSREGIWVFWIVERLQLLIFISVSRISIFKSYLLTTLAHILHDPVDHITDQIPNLCRPKQKPQSSAINKIVIGQYWGLVLFSQKN